MGSAPAPSGVKRRRILLALVVASTLMRSGLTPYANPPIQFRVELFQDFFTGQDCKIIWKQTLPFEFDAKSLTQLHKDNDGRHSIVQA